MIGVVTCLPGVRLFQANGAALRPAGIRILAAADQFARSTGLSVVVTCGTEGHREGKHPRGEALDFRSKAYTPGQVLRFHAWMRQQLGPDFRVLYEIPATVAPRDAVLSPIVYVSGTASAEHFHVQLRKDLTTWPPVAQPVPEPGLA